MYFLGEGFHHVIGEFFKCVSDNTFFVVKTIVHQAFLEILTTQGSYGFRRQEILQFIERWQLRLRESEGLWSHR